VKLNSTPKVPFEYQRSKFIEILAGIDNKVNTLAEGRLQGRHYTGTETPSSSAIPAAVGDIVWNSNVTVQGTVAAQYVLIGWACTASGTPGVWRDMRLLTGT